MRPAISLIDQTPKPPQPIDALGDFEAISNSELCSAIAAQLEYTGAELIVSYQQPDFHVFRDLIVTEILGAFRARRLIDFNFTWEWYTSYRIEDRAQGCAVVWTTDKGSTLEQAFQLRTKLLHSVGRERLRQCAGVAFYKRTRYERDLHAANFLLNKD